MNPESRTMLPKMAFTGFASRYREPTVNEGFDDITKVNFKVRLVMSCWRCVGMWHTLNPAPRLAAAVRGSQLTSIDSSMGPKRRGPNGASSGYREKLQYVRKTKERKLGSEFPRVHAERHVTSDSNVGSLTLLTTRITNQARRGEAEMGSVVRPFTLRLTCAKQHHRERPSSTRTWSSPRPFPSGRPA